MQGGPEVGPVFVVGLPRSGTTLLKACLNRHSQVHLLGETRFFLTPYSHRRAWMRFADWADVAVRQCFSGIDPSLDPYREREAVEYRAAFDLDQSGSAGELFRRLLAGLAAEQGKTICGEKTPLHYLALPSIFRCFPDARVIFVLRAPDRIDRSVRGRRNFQMDTTRLEALLHLQNAALRRFGKRVLQVQYADLCNASEATLRRVCGYLGIAFEGAMLRPGIQNSSRNTDVYEAEGRYLVQNPDLSIAPAPDEPRFDMADMPPITLPVRLNIWRTRLRQAVADRGLNLPGSWRVRSAPTHAPEMDPRRT